MNSLWMPPGASLIILLGESTVRTRRLAGGSPDDPALLPAVFRGLCVNCDLRYGCTYPKPPGGVWSCDEYV